MLVRNKGYNVQYSVRDGNHVLIFENGRCGYDGDSITWVVYMRKQTVILLVIDGLEQHFIDVVEEIYICFQFDDLVKLCDSQVINDTVLELPDQIVDDMIIM